MSCEPLSDDLQVSWQVKGDDITIELAGNISRCLAMLLFMSDILSITHVVYTINIGDFSSLLVLNYNDAIYDTIYDFIHDAI